MLPVMEVVLPLKPSRMIRSLPRNVASVPGHLDGGKEEGCSTCFEEANSASQVCEIYRQVLQKHALATANMVAVYAQPAPVSPDEGVEDDDCMSIFSELGSIAAASDIGDMDACFSDADSVALRRKQMHPNPQTNATTSQLANTLRPPVDRIPMAEDDEDLVSLASSVDTLYSFDL